MQPNQGANSSGSVVPSNGPRLSTTSHSSVTAATATPTNVLLNGLVPSHRSSQTLLNVPVSFASARSRPLRKGSEQFNRTEKVKHASIVICLSVLLALLLIISVEVSVELVRDRSSALNSTSSSFNRTPSMLVNIAGQDGRRLRSFFAAVWLFNGLLSVHCLFIHVVSVRRHSRRARTVPLFLR
jgi:hypothetical protein